MTSMHAANENAPARSGNSSEGIDPNPQDSREGDPPMMTPTTDQSNAENVADRLTRDIERVVAVDSPPAEAIFQATRLADSLVGDAIRAGLARPEERDAFHEVAETLAAASEILAARYLNAIANGAGR